VRRRTGAFLEEMSARLDIPLERMNDLAARSTDMVKLGSFCTVFSQRRCWKTSPRQKIEDIVKGVFFSVIRRVLEMDSLSQNVVMTGGVAHTCTSSNDGRAHRTIDPGPGKTPADRRHRRGALRDERINEKDYRRGGNSKSVLHILASHLMSLFKYRGCSCPKKESVRKKIAAAADLNNFMRDYYLELDAAVQKAHPRSPWCTSVGPAEILRAFVSGYFPETHSAMLGATRMATEFIPRRMPSAILPRSAPISPPTSEPSLRRHPPRESPSNIKSIPKPDVLGSTPTNPDVQDWFNWYGEKFDRAGAGRPHVPRVSVVTDKHIYSIAKHWNPGPALGKNRREKFQLET